MGGVARSSRSKDLAWLGTVLVASVLLAAGGDAGAPPEDRPPSSPPAAGAPGPEVPRAFVLRDDFDNGDPPASSGWRSTGAWTVTPAGVLHGPDRASSLLTGRPEWRDVSVTVRVAPAGDERAGVLVRSSSDGGRTLRLTWDRTAHRVDLDRVDDDAATPLATGSVDQVAGAPWHELAVRAVGDRVTASVDGRPGLDVTLPSSPDDQGAGGGLVGLASSGSRSAFDDVRVRAAVDWFTVAVLPDTQFYTPHVRPAASRFTAQTRWLVRSRASEQVAVVLHEGDLVDDACSAAQWRVAAFAMARLDGKLPQAIALGNHDAVGRRAGCTRSPGVPPQRFRPTTSYQLFEAGGIRFVVIALPFGPTAAMLRWARGIAADHADRVGIVVTHDYLAPDGRLRGDPRTQAELPDGPGQLTGRRIWSDLVQPSRNIRLVVSGHVIQCQSRSDATCRRIGVVGRRVAPNAAGDPVVQLLADYQVVAHGGNGYLRLLRFTPAERRLQVRTWSPTARRELADPRNRFALAHVDLR